MLSPEQTTFIAVLVAWIAAILGGSAAARFAAALAGLKSRGAVGRAVIVLWLARLGIAPRDREDAAQDVLLRAFRLWHTIDPDRQVQGANPPEAERNTFHRWIQRITRDVAAHHRDRAHHRVEELRPEPCDEAAPDLAPWPDATIESDQARIDLLTRLAALARIAPYEAAVVLAHEIDGIPMAEIAEQQGIPLSTAYRWRARGIAALRAAEVDEEEEE